MSKDAYWFRHDSNASRDPKIMVMRTIYGFEGYGMYWGIIESLREQPDYKIKIGGKYGFKVLAGMIGANADTLEPFVLDCVKEFELFQIEGDYLACEALENRMKRWEANKANGAKGGRPKNPIKTQPKPKVNPIESQSEPNQKPTETIKRREEDSIEDKSKNKPENVDTVIKYFTERKATAYEGRKFMNYYQSNGWKVGKNPMKDWKAAARGWIDRNGDTNGQAKNVASSPSQPAN